MAIDLLVLWLVARKLRGRAKLAVYVGWIVACLLLAGGALMVAQRFTRHGIEPGSPGMIVLFRVGAIVAVLEAYFISTLVWMPRLFDRLEGWFAELVIAVRQLRARKSGFLTVISFLAFLGVGLGSFALCMTISVMGGFGNDLKQKILGNNAHVVVDRERGGFSDWRPLLARVAAVPGVQGATPLVQGEVMVTSQTNLSGVILRGIDPANADRVIDLRRNIIRGRIEYLTQPGRLGSLTAWERRPLPARGEDDPQSPPRGPTATGPSRTIERGPNDPAPPPPPVPPPPPPGTEPGQSVEALPGIIVGRELATNLHLAVGDEVRVVSPFGSLGPLGPIPKTKLFRVAAIFYSGMYEYDTKYAYVTIPVAQRFFNYERDEITSIELKLSDIERSDDVVEALGAIAAPRQLRVRDWKQLNQNLFRALKLEKLMIFLLLTVAIIVASFSIVATLLLLVTEKGREIAVLKAMGASDGFITRVFVCVGMMIGVVGALLGVTAALVTCLVMQRIGIPLDPEVYYIERLPVTISLADYAMVFVTAVLICLAAATFPAYLAGRLRPVEGLRFG